MFNEEIKLKFIKQYTKNISTAKTCESAFNMFEEYERAWGMDICAASTDDLQPLIDSMFGVRARSKMCRLTILKEYARWCIETGVDGAGDGLLNVNVAGVEAIRQHTVASPMHLQKYLDEICSPESYESNDNIYRCYFWLAYSGVEEDDILNIKISDIDLSSMSIKYNGTILPIYREAILAFKKCTELTSFKIYHPNYSSPVPHDRAPGDTVVRGIKPINSPHAFSVNLSKKTKDYEERTGIRLSYFKTWLSGIFYRARELEVMGEKVDFYPIVIQKSGNKKYKLDSGRNTVQAKLRSQAREYLGDYQRWKLAFGN